MDTDVEYSYLSIMSCVIFDGLALDLILAENVARSTECRQSFFNVVSPNTAYRRQLL
jgi:hypothetical protein